MHPVRLSIRTLQNLLSCFHTGRFKEITGIHCQRSLQKHVNSQTDIAPVSTCPLRDLFFFLSLDTSGTFRCIFDDFCLCMEVIFESYFSSLCGFCFTARRDTIVRTRPSPLVLLAAIGSPIGSQFPYVDMDWSLCVLEAISGAIRNRRNRVASGISGRPEVQFWKVPPFVGIWSESWRMFQSTSPFWMRLSCMR